MSNILPAPAGLHHVTKMSTVNMNYRQTVNHYKQKGYSLVMAEFFADIDYNSFYKKTEHQTEEQINNKQIIKSQFNRLDKLININHVKLNKWFHLDNPNGFGFPDEVWSLIKSYNPPQLKKLKCIKWKGEKIFTFKKFITKTFNNWHECSSWYLLNPTDHFNTMINIVKLVTKRRSWETSSVKVGHDRKMLLCENDCSREELKNYLVEKDIIHTNGEMKGIFWKNKTELLINTPRKHHIPICFVNLSYASKNFMNIRMVYFEYIGIKKEWRRIETTIKKKIKKDDNNILTFTNLSKKNHEPFKYADEWGDYKVIDWRSAIPVSAIVSNPLVNHPIIEKTFGKIPDKYTWNKVNGRTKTSYIVLKN